jgi:hypothetical protein
MTDNLLLLCVHLLCVMVCLYYCSEYPRSLVSDHQLLIQTVIHVANARQHPGMDSMLLEMLRQSELDC